MTTIYLSGILVLAGTLAPVMAEDWTTSDGKTYKDVVVVSHDAKIVTINSADGPATFPIAFLDKNLQSRIQADHATSTNWTVDGKDYQNVTIGQVEADIVHISYDNGVATVPIADLPPDLQKRLNYDPAKAKAASEERAQEEKKAAAAAALISVQKEQAEQAAQAEQEQAELSDRLEQNSLQIRLRISRKVHDNSAVVDFDVWGDRTVDAKGGVATGWWPNDGQILVIGIPSDSVDGDTWQGKVYYAGTYTDGVSTLRQWATTKEEALRLLKESASKPPDADGPQVPSQ